MPVDRSVKKEESAVAALGGGERLAVPLFQGCQIHHCLLHARMMCKYLATAWSMGNFLENPVKSANLFCLGSRRREDPDTSGAGEWERYLPIWENYFPPPRGSRPAAGGVFAPVPASSLAAARGARLSRRNPYTGTPGVSREVAGQSCASCVNGER